MICRVPAAMASLKGFRWYSRLLPGYVWFLPLYNVRFYTEKDLHGDSPVEMRILAIFDCAAARKVFSYG